MAGGFEYFDLVVFLFTVSQPKERLKQRTLRCRLVVQERGRMPVTAQRYNKSVGHEPSSTSS